MGYGLDMTAGSKKNFRVLLTQGVFNNAAYSFGSDRLVFPFLYAAAGGPALFAGLIMPLVIVFKMLSQLLGAPKINRARSNTLIIAVSSVITALALACVSFLFDQLPPTGVVVLFLLAAAVMGMASGFGSLAFSHLTGRMFAKDQMSKLLFSQSAIAGLLAIAIAVTSMFVLPPGTSLAAHREVILLGVALYICAAVLILFVHESAKSTMGQTRSPAGNFLLELRSGFKIAFALPWFKSFVLIRAFFLSVELAMPFYSIHAAALHSNSTTGLTLFVIGSSLGLVIGGLLWSRIASNSFSRLFILSAAVAFGAGALALLIEVQTVLQSPLIYAPVFVLIGLAAQGAKIGRSVYLSSKSSNEQRPFCISVSNVITGLLSVAIGLIIGVVAMYKGVAAPIIVIMGLNVIAAILVRRLD